MKARLFARGVFIQDGHALVNDTKRSLKLIGGRVGRNENIEDALVREWLEEVGFLVKVGPLVTMSSRIVGKRGRRVRHIEMVYAVTSPILLGPTVVAEKGINPVWITHATLAAMLGESLADQLYSVNERVRPPAKLVPIR